jgi:heme-degrading monooxygenase HmoA
MFAVIFQAKMKKIDDEYANVAERMRHLALSEFGCIKFSALTEGVNEIAISYWPNEEKILAWKRYSEHLIAQELGRERWYESYEVQICKVERQYHFPH